MVKTYIHWTKDTQEKQTEEAFVVKLNTDGVEAPQTLTFDASHYKVKDRSYGGLSNTVRRILMKHPLSRTKEELHALTVSKTINIFYMDFRYKRCICMYYLV